MELINFSGRNDYLGYSFYKHVYEDGQEVYVCRYVMRSTEILAEGFVESAYQQVIAIPPSVMEEHLTLILKNYRKNRGGEYDTWIRLACEYFITHMNEHTLDLSHDLVGKLLYVILMTARGGLKNVIHQSQDG